MRTRVHTHAPPTDAHAHLTVQGSSPRPDASLRVLGTRQRTCVVTPGWRANRAWVPRPSLAPRCWLLSSVTPLLRPALGQSGTCVHPKRADSRSGGCGTSLLPGRSDAPRLPVRRQPQPPAVSPRVPHPSPRRTPPGPVWPPADTSRSSAVSRRGSCPSATVPTTPPQVTRRALPCPPSQLSVPGCVNELHRSGPVTGAKQHRRPLKRRNRAFSRRGRPGSEARCRGRGCC